jgi:hypothetical protein
MNLLFSAPLLVLLAVIGVCGIRGYSFEKGKKLNFRQVAGYLSFVAVYFGLLIALTLLTINVYVAQAQIESMTSFAAANLARADHQEGKIKLLRRSGQLGPTGQIIDGIPEWGWPTHEAESLFFFVKSRDDLFIEKYNEAMRRKLESRQESPSPPDR